MADTSQKEVLRSLARLVRGLSALFWGLPLMLVFYVQTALTDWLSILDSLAIMPLLLVTGLVFYGLQQMHHFQRQERIWIRALDRAQLLIYINFGLVPFLYWWHRMPGVKLYAMAVTLLGFCSILFLHHLNHVMERLVAMLPDEALRLETQLFSSLNRTMLAAIPVLMLIYTVLAQIKILPNFLIQILGMMEPFKLWPLLFLILMPLAMTMALLWKIKEVIFASVFESDHR